MVLPGRCVFSIHKLLWSLFIELPWIFVSWIHKLLQLLDTPRFPLLTPFGITLEMCTLGTQTTVDPRYTLDRQTVVDPWYTLLPHGLVLWYYLGDVYSGYTICCRSLIHLISPAHSFWYNLGYTNCTLDTQTLVDPRYTS